MRRARSDIPAANRERIARDFDTLARIGRSEAGGLDREAFSVAHLEAQSFLLERAREAGLDGRLDAIGNVFARTAKGDGPVVLTGSHLDSVPRGGSYDGAVGVIGALEALRTIVENDTPIARPLELVGFAEEEGRFTGLLGSAAMLGMVSADELEGLFDGRGVSLKDALALASLDIAQIGRAKRDTSGLNAFVELHIEQGAFLHREAIPIGVVTAIGGTYRLIVHLAGRADHAGATPMDARQDPLLAAAEIIRAVRAVIDKSGRPTARGTVGVVEVEPNVSSVVPEKVRLVVDIRDVDAEARQLLVEQVEESIGDACRRERVRWRTENPMAAPPGPTDPGVQRTIEDVCDRLRIRHVKMISGASHDAQNVAKFVPTGMIFIPSRDGRSHSAAEYSDPEDIARGVDVLIGTLLALAQ